MISGIAKNPCNTTKKTIHLKLHYCTDRKQAIPSKIWTAKSIKQVGKRITINFNNYR